MSRYQSTNPFEDDEDDSDFVLTNKGKPAATYSFNNDNNPAFTSSSRPKKPANPFDEPSPSSSSSNHQSNGRYNEEDSLDDRLHRLQLSIDQSEHRQLESTQRALASIYDSEAMGVATAEELVRQGEMLDNIEQKTDGMQNTLTTSQKHINNIRSVFGGIKNWWSGRGDKKTAQADSTQYKGNNSQNRLQAELTRQSRYDTSGFKDEEDLDARFMAGSSRKPGDGQYKVIQPVTRSAREDELDFNLDMMSSGMSRLKGLAQGLGDEIERQNEQLDRINVKVEDTDDILTNQNRQMRKILKK